MNSRLGYIGMLFTGAAFDVGNKNVLYSGLVPELVIFTPIISLVVEHGKVSD